MFGTGLVYKMNAAFRSNFCYISLIRFGAPVIFLYKASLRDDRRRNSELHIVTKERNHTLRQEIWVQNVKLKIFRFSVFFRCLMTLFIFICVKRKKLCNCHSSLFFFFSPSHHFVWADWQKLFSKFCPIAALSASDQDRS